MTCTLIIIGYDANALLPTGASSDPLVQTVVARCENCENGITVSVVPSTTADTGFSIARASLYPHKPAETYVLKFSSEPNAASWITAYQAYLVNKTVIQLNPDV